MSKKIIFSFLFFSILLSHGFAQEDLALKQVMESLQAHIIQRQTNFTELEPSSRITQKYLNHNNAVFPIPEWGYDEIKEDLKPLKPGGYVFTSIDILKTFKAKVPISRTNLAVTEDAYFVLLRYNIVALYPAPDDSNKERRLVVLDNSLLFDRYFIFTVDKIDGRWKAVDGYPRTRGELAFHSIPGILGRTNVSISEADKVRLYKEYLKFD